APLGPTLLGVYDVLFPPTPRPRAQRRKIGTRPRFGKALAPEDIGVGGLRQEILLLLLFVELCDHRPAHGNVEADRRRHVRLLHLVLVHVDLYGRPVLTAPLY